MTIQLTPEVSNFLFVTATVTVICGGFVAAAIRYASTIRDLIS